MRPIRPFIAAFALEPDSDSDLRYLIYINSCLAHIVRGSFGLPPGSGLSSSAGHHCVMSLRGLFPP